MTVSAKEVADAAWAAQQRQRKPNGSANESAIPKMVSAAELVAREFREPKWAVPQMIAEGLTIFAGKPKTGKSWAALDFAVSVAGGYCALGNIDCQQGDVLLLALEDNDRRLQQRLKAVLQSQPAPRRYRSRRAGGVPTPAGSMICVYGLTHAQRHGWW